MFKPLRTDRLLLREMALDDVDGLWERRNDPRVAEYQNWTIPYSREEASRVVAGVVAMDGPEDDEWWMCAVAEGATGEMVGGLALHLEHDARTAEIGYTLAPEHWGKGYASEAARAVWQMAVSHFSDTPLISLIFSENERSIRLAKAIGAHLENEIPFRGMTAHIYRHRSPTQCQHEVIQVTSECVDQTSLY